MVDPELEKILEEGQAVIPGRFIGECQGAEFVGVPSDEHSDETSIELVRHGDVIQAIDVTCECGRKIRIRCVYQDE